MNRQAEKQKAWDDWHDDPDIDPDDIPRVNPSFSKGFDAAWDALMLEIKPLVADLYTVRLTRADPATFNSNEAVNRLRDLTREE